MNQFAVRSLGLGVTLMTLIQLPVSASSRALSVRAQSTLRPSLSVVDGANSVIADPAAQPQLLAQLGLTARSLRPGDEGANVRALQRYLSRNGRYSFAIDGIYGSETANAVSVYQRIRDLPATGIADEATLADMGFEFLPGATQQSFNSGVPLPPSQRNFSGSGVLAPGSTGTSVIALQQRLNDFGIPLFVDGVYGFETQQAVRSYQQIQGLPVTGNADSDTLRAMGLSSAVAESPFRYVSAVIADRSQLNEVLRFFEDAYIDSDRRGEYINIGDFAERFPAEARVNAARAVGFNTRVIYRRRGLFN